MEKETQATYHMLMLIDLCTAKTINSIGLGHRLLAAILCLLPFGLRPHRHHRRLSIQAHRVLINQNNQQRIFV